MLKLKYSEELRENYELVSGLQQDFWWWWIFWLRKGPSLLLAKLCGKSMNLPHDRCVSIAQPRCFPFCFPLSPWLSHLFLSTCSCWTTAVPRVLVEISIRNHTGLKGEFVMRIQRLSDPKARKAAGPEPRWPPGLLPTCILAPVLHNSSVPFSPDLEGLSVSLSVFPEKPRRL